MSRTDQQTDLARRGFVRILLIKPSSLGDIVHALPVLEGLRTRYPDARIDWLIAKPFAPLIQGHPALSEIVMFDRNRFGGMAVRPWIAAEFVSFLRALHARRYDLTIDLQGLLRSGILAMASGAPVRIGFADARELAWAAYTHRIEPAGPDTHAIDRNYRVAALLGFEDAPIRMRLPVGQVELAGARRLLGDAGLAHGEPFLLVAPAARWDTKVWPWDRFVALIDALSNGDGVRSVLIGSANEKTVCDRIVATCGSSPANVAGRTDLRTMAALIGMAGAVLCHDSAALHVAVALERPAVCLVGPTNPARTGPYRGRGEVVRRELDCAPCYLRRIARCPHAHRCMRDLAPSTVLAAVRRALADGLHLAGSTVDEKR